MKLLLLFLPFLFAVGCGTTNFPVRQTPPPGMNAAIQQEVVADAIDAAVAKLDIDAKASWESTVRVRMKSPFSVYGVNGNGEDAGVLGYLRTMVEAKLTEHGFHVVSSDTAPDWEIIIDVRTAGAEVKDEDYVVYQKSTLKAMVSFRIFVRDLKNQGDKPYLIAQSESVSDPYVWRNSILYFIDLPGVKYRPLGEPNLWDRLFSLKRDVGGSFTYNQAGMSQAPATTK